MSLPPFVRYAYNNERIGVTILKSGILYIDWKGPQDLQSIRREGATLLGIQREAGFTRAVNSNITVTGDWDEALPYVTDEWFPAMARYGLRYFAWILPVDAAAMTSVRKVTTTSVSIATFSDLFTACTWLYSLPDAHTPSLFD
jgi:hypothetical protein